MKRINKASEQIIIYITVFVFFLLTLAENFSGPHDSIRYLNYIKSGTLFPYQHHLLYHITAYYWLSFLQPIFPHVKDYYLVEVYTALWGSGTVVILYNFFRNRFFLSRWESLLSLATIIFSYGFWFYSTNIEVYAPPMFFILAALYILTRKGFTTADLTKVVILQICAILFHQVNILFSVVVLYKLWLERKRLNVPRALALYALAGLVFVGGAYFLVGWVIEGHHSLASWVGWMEGYAGTDEYWQGLSTKTPVHVLIGLSHAFVGGHYIFQLPPIKAYLNHSLNTHSLSDELFLGRQMSETTAMLLFALMLVLAALMLWMLVRFIRRYKTIVEHYGQVVPMLLVCGLTYSLFFCFWMPEILEFWLLQTVLFWLLIMGTLPVAGTPYHIPPDVIRILFISLLFTTNFFGSVRWLQHIGNDWFYEKVKKVSKVATPRDMILLQDGWILGDFASYYTKARVEEVPSKKVPASEIDKAITDCLSNKGKVYIFTELNNGNFIPDTHYIDSLRKAFGDREKVFHAADPHIEVIE